MSSYKLYILSKFLNIPQNNSVYPNIFRFLLSKLQPLLLQCLLLQCLPLQCYRYHWLSCYAIKWYQTNSTRHSLNCHCRAPRPLQGGAPPCRRRAPPLQAPRPPVAPAPRAPAPQISMLNPGLSSSTIPADCRAVLLLRRRRLVETSDSKVQAHLCDAPAPR